MFESAGQQLNLSLLGFKLYKKWFQSLRSGFPLERGIARLDFNKLRCASK
jgi:hypothetical protein